MTPARPTPTAIPRQWKLLARDAVHWRPPPSPAPKAAVAKHAYHPYGRPSPPSTPSFSGRSINDSAHPIALRRSPSSNSDSSLSSLSPSPEPDSPPLKPSYQVCDPAQSYHDQHYYQPSHAQPPPTPTSALGLSDLPSLAQAALTTYSPYPPTSGSLEAEVRLAQLVHASPPEHRDYLTPSPTPSRDEYDPTDAYIVYPEEEEKPIPRIQHMWTSPMHPPEVRFLTLQPGGGYEEGLIYALVSHPASNSSTSTKRANTQPTKLLPFFTRLQWVTAVPGRRVVLPAQSRFAVQRREAADAINRLLEKEGACAGWE